jgi:hypothetical protein
VVGTAGYAHSEETKAPQRGLFHFNKLPKPEYLAGEATLYADRKLCDPCGQNGGVRSLARQLGLTKLTVITPDGTATPWP